MARRIGALPLTTAEKKRRWFERDPEHAREVNRKWKAANREKVRASNKRSHDKKGVAYHRDRHLRLRYRITLAEQTDLLAAQSGACAICRRSFDDLRICVDHDHTTGAVRGLLCDRCNRGLGALQDSPRLLLAAARYLGGSA